MEFNDSMMQDAPAAPPPAAPPANDTVTISKAEFESLQRQLNESRESERFWSTQARSGGRQAAAPQVPTEPEYDARDFIDEEAQQPAIADDTPSRFVDEFAAQGMPALTKRGLVTRAEAQRIATEAALKVTREVVSNERQRYQSDQTILTDFPELKNKDSALFKETAKRYQAAVALDQGAMKTPAALYLAAQGAKDYLDYQSRQAAAEEPEDDRQRRAQSQDSRPRGGQAQEHDDAVGPEAREIARQMGITEQEFIESRRLMGGGRSRQGGRR